MPARQNRNTKIEILLVLGFYGVAPNANIVKNTLVRSIGRFCDTEFIDRVVIIVPERQYMPLSAIVGALPVSVTIGTCEEFLSSIGMAATPENPEGTREIVEAYFSTVCRTDYYLILDETSLVTGFINHSLYDNGRMPADPAESMIGADLEKRPSEIAAGVSGASVFHPIFVNCRAVRDALENDITLDTIRCWRDTYWRSLEREGTYHSLYYERKLSVSFKTPLDLKTSFGGNNHSSVELFSTFSGLSTNENTEKFVEKRLTTKVGGLYEYVAESVVNNLLHQSVDIWQTSFGGVGSNYIARMLRVRGAPEIYELICHFPYPLPVQKPNFKAIYVFGDPELAVISQLKKNHQINMAKNSNMNYSMPWCYEFSLEKYAAERKDYFNLAQHFHNWTSPEGPLGKVSYPVLMLRFQTSMKYLAFIGDYLGLDDVEIAALEQKFVIKPRDSSDTSATAGPDVVSIRQIYKDLAAEIEAFPDAAVWNPVTRRIHAL